MISPYSSKFSKKITFYLHCPERVVYCIYTYGKELLRHIRLIQEANVLVVNSCGNIIDSEAEPYIADYPKYLLKFPCYSPAEAKSIFSVGSICRSSTSEEIKISSFTRLGVTPLLMSSLDQRSNYIKPDINTYGGNNIIDISSNRITNSSDLEFPVFTNTGEIVYKVGTSLAAPLISQSFLKLKNLYPHYYNSETFKAMLLNQAKIHSCENQPLFSLLTSRHCAKQTVLCNL
jgi:hypothetical protein